VDPTTAALSRLGRFTRAMSPDHPAVDVILQETRRLLTDAGVAFKIVGGVAVVHHGYERATVDVDVLIGADALPRIDAALAAHGFERPAAHRLRHVPTEGRVDLLVAGAPLPRAGAGVYPSPTELGASPRDKDVVDLPGLVALKLRAGRKRDVADVVELLKRLDDARYTALEADVDRALRPTLADLRRDALEELRSDGG
jgi:hypothetical protein